MPLEPVPPGAAVTLRDADARSPEADRMTKNELGHRLRELTDRLDQLQTALYAEGKRAVLVVLQGRDTSGKDGAIRGVFGPLDPQGVAVTSFKAPTSVELSHDYLWRIHRAVPPKGTIGVFNRSHYEDVLVVRVHGLVPESVWRPRYQQINLFERILAENGITILKFFLHISREEQRARLRARLDDPTKCWKFAAGDLKERDRWDDYTRAYEEMLSRTSPASAPWYLVPADRKPVRDLLIARVVVETMERMDPRFPGPPAGIEEFRKALD
ncbi:MAG: PPK2 family polyphosphate kinase [Pseudonocardiaceae bacterium]